jgi:hypothetical protein
MQLLQKSKNLHLWLSLIFSLIIFVVFFPQFYTSNDERNYIQNAYYLSQDGLEGLVRTDVECGADGSEAYGFIVPENASVDKEGCISKYNLGVSFILSPFIQLDWKMAFVITFLFFAISVIIFYKLLDILNISRWFIYFYAFFPPFAYYSHKTFGEIYSVSIITALILLIYYSVTLKYLKFRSIIFTLIGVLSGILVLIRYTNALIILGLVLLYLLINSGNFKERVIASLKNWIFIVVGAFPFVLVFFYINTYLYGGLIKSGYSLAGEEFFWNISLFIKQIPLYLVNVNAMYPLLFIIIIYFGIKKSGGRLVNSLRYVSLIMLCVYILLYGGFYGYNFNQGINNLILGYRFLLPITPLILLVYFYDLDQVYRYVVAKFNIKLTKVIILITILILGLGKVLIARELYFRVEYMANESNLLYESYSKDEVIDKSYVLINDAFGKGKRYVKRDIWTPPSKINF